jgi:SAM-dependent methyltransferase
MHFHNSVDQSNSMQHALADDWDRHWTALDNAARRNPAQKYRRRLILDCLQIAGDGRGARVLDIGSGQGDLALDLLERHPAADCVGVELSRSGVSIAAQRVPRARFFERDLLQASAPPEGLQSWATHAICSEVLEHLDEPERLIANSLAWMAPGCRVVVTVPGGPMSSFDRHIGHRQHYDPVSLWRLLERAGLQVESVTRAGFPFFNLYRLAVIARGDRLLHDVSLPDGADLSWAAQAAMRLFDAAFSLNLSRGRFGWQMLALARLAG